MRLYKLGALAERLARFGNLVGRELPRVRNDGPDFQFNADACGAGAFGEARGIIPQNLVGADVDEKRWKAGEIGVQRRRERIARVGVS